MIKLFRKIRLNFLNEGKTSKYFKYAIGEIVLVVIGILIALQINNWNENRKASNEEIKILNALQEDFKVSKERILGTIKSQTKAIEYGHILIEIYERQNKDEFQYFDTHLDSLSNLIGFGSSWYREELVTGAYNSLISAGKIDLIQNADLRNKLAQFIADFESGFEDHESTMGLLEELGKETKHFTLKIASKKIRTYYNYNPRKIDSLKISESFFTNDEYFGNLFLKSTLEYNRLVRQNLLLEQIKTILKSIQQELVDKSN